VRVAEGQWERLQFLARVTHKECLYLQETDSRLFADPMTLESLQKMEVDPVLAERLDAFVGRFDRLQDNLGDKLLPQLLDAMAEKQAQSLKTWTGQKSWAGSNRPMSGSKYASCATRWCMNTLKT